jgi:hypothetical protein
MEVGGSLRLPDSRGGYRSAGMGPGTILLLCADSGRTIILCVRPNRS